MGAGAGALPPIVGPPGPDLAQHYFIFSLFFFCPTLEIGRKCLKNPKNVKPIFLDSLFSIVFNKNSFMIFRTNREFWSI
jgi:hypothetical protein